MMIFVIFLAFFTGCHPVYNTRGHNLETIKLDELKVKGKSSKPDTMKTIVEKFGTPSYVSPLEKTYYYFSKKTRHVSFLTPVVLENKIVKLIFDDNENLVTVATYTGEKEIACLKEKTPSAGYESSALKEIFGNFGKHTSGKSAPRPTYES